MIRASFFFPLKRNVLPPGGALVPTHGVLANENGQIADPGGGGPKGKMVRKSLGPEGP
jgi:hypothetical protein